MKLIQCGGHTDNSVQRSCKQQALHMLMTLVFDGQDMITCSSGLMMQRLSCLLRVLRLIWTFWIQMVSCSLKLTFILQLVVVMTSNKASSAWMKHITTFLFLQKRGTEVDNVSKSYPARGCRQTVKARRHGTGLFATNAAGKHFPNVYL